MFDFSELSPNVSSSVGILGKDVRTIRERGPVFPTLSLFTLITTRFPEEIGCSVSRREDWNRGIEGTASFIVHHFFPLSSIDCYGIRLFLILPIVLNCRENAPLCRGLRTSSISTSVR